MRGLHHVLCHDQLRMDGQRFIDNSSFRIKKRCFNMFAGPKCINAEVDAITGKSPLQHAADFNRIGRFPISQQNSKKSGSGDRDSALEGILFVHDDGVV
jgi:hypothetical protein